MGNGSEGAESELKKSYCITPKLDPKLPNESTLLEVCTGVGANACCCSVGVVESLPRLGKDYSCIRAGLGFYEDVCEF